MMSVAYREMPKSPVLPKKLFVWGMIWATAAPLIIFLIIFRPLNHEANSDSYNAFIWMSQFIAQGHVGLTALLYFDRGFSKVISKHKVRFIWIPFALIVILPFALMLDPLLLNTATMLLVVWNIWHFNKQNIGVYALVSIGAGCRPPNSLEKYLINTACIFAILAHYPANFPTYLHDLGIHSILVAIGDLAVYPFLLVVAFGALYAFMNRERYSISKAVFYSLALTMFGSVFVAREIFTGEAFVVAAGYAAAHSWQYIVILYLMTVSAGKRGQLVAGQRLLDWNSPWATTGIALAVAVLVHAFWGLYAMKGLEFFRSLDQAFGTSVFAVWLVGFGIAILYSHFIADAGAFRLSQQEQRGHLQDRLAFLLRR